MSERAIVVGTRNPKKLRELGAILGTFGIAAVSIDDVAPDAPTPDENGETFEDNARIKALEYAAAAGLPCLADDSGLAVDYLDGRPGVHSSRYGGVEGDDARNNAKLLDELVGVAAENRSAAFHCVIAVAVPGEVVLVVDGRCPGRILEEARGEEGFGYDPLFLPEASDRTFAQLEGAEKASVSHRGQALAQLGRRLPEIVDRLFGPNP